MRNWIGKIILLWMAALIVSACGAFEIGIEHIPPGSAPGTVDWQATAETLQIEATQTSNSVSAANLMAVQALQVLPTVVPTAQPPNASNAQRAAAVAYLLGGDIWVKTLPDGEAQRLTQDGRNRMPRWSASGDWLSFLKDPEFPQLWVMRRDGSEAQQIGALVGEAYAWSPVDDRLAYADGASIHIVAAGEEAGAGLSLVAQVDVLPPAGTNGQIGRIAWRPDGEQLAYTQSAYAPEGGMIKDGGIWVVDTEGGRPEQLLEGNVPDAGQIILHGWSGDGRYLLYWQAPVLSASILADGVPLYALPVDGGEPQAIADAVLVHDDAVQAEPNGGQIAVVAGSGRAVWAGKTLLLVFAHGPEPWHLSPMEQSAASPAWSPDGSMMAYVGMPDATNEVVGGPEAQSALQQRRIWVIDMQTLEPVVISGANAMDEANNRDEAPQWLDNQTLLFARLDAEGGASLWTVGADGTNLQQVVEELTPAPDWFGFYGYIDWSPLFALWRPSAPAITPTAAPLYAASAGAVTLARFLDGLYPGLTGEEAAAMWGEPQMREDMVDETGRRLSVYQYVLGDGLTLHLGFAVGETLVSVQLHTPQGRAFLLTRLDESNNAAGGTAMPTPAQIATVTATPLPTALPPASSSGDENPTPTPELALPPTATPIPTVPPPHTPQSRP